MSIRQGPTDDELARQLAHLDALAERSFALTDAEDEPAAGDAGPRAPRSAAAALGGDEAALRAELVAASAECDRLASHWQHIRSHVERLRPDELDAVVDALAAAAGRRARAEARLDRNGAAAGPPAPATGAAAAAVVDTLAAVVLELDVARRVLAREHGEATAQLLDGAIARIVAAGERLRDDVAARPISAAEPA